MTFTTGISVLALIAGLLYGAMLLATDSVFEASSAAVFVLVTFYTNVSVIELPLGSSKSHLLDVLLVNVVVVSVCQANLWLYSGDISLAFGPE